MKKVLFLITLVLFVTSSVYAANFSPTLMKLSAPEIIQYNFDGSQLEIQLQVIGKPATTVFSVYTKGMAEGIGEVKNGHLGWHYINKIDTCIYVSQPTLFDIGKNRIVWSGKNNDGGTVPAGEYTYYIWGYDSVNQKQVALREWNLQYGRERYTVESKDVNGLLLANPIAYLCPNDYSLKTKWIIGGMDIDISAKDLETTTFPEGYTNAWETIVLDPQDHTKFFAQHNRDNTLYICKWNWIPNGIATIIPEWGENGEYLWTKPPEGSGPYSNGLEFDGYNTLFATFAAQYALEAQADLLFLDMENGTELQQIDLTKWYSSVENRDNGGQMNGGPTDLKFQNGILYTQAQHACEMIALDPSRDEEEMVVWANMNGDYVHDMHYEVDDQKAWMCNDFLVGPYMYTLDTDANGFSIFPCYDIGALSFGLVGPDGKGIGYFAFTGETAGWKTTSFYLDVGSAYDGMYMDNEATGGSIFDQWDPTKIIPGIFFMGHDSIKGVITNQVAVNDDTPSAFSVMQNSPNPFNPTTTISFMIPEAGQVSIDVFNVAGQKVDTVASEFMSAGAHSVTWDASGFSAGVYFYTVKSGNFSRTMKMTLLK